MSAKENVITEISDHASDPTWLSEHGPFSEDQQRVLEACFEGYVDYRPDLYDSHDRLRALMVNLIRNKGSLVLLDRSLRRGRQNDDIWND